MRYDAAVVPAESKYLSRVVYVVAAVLFVALAYDLLRLPVQLHDSLGDIQDVRAAPSALAAFTRELGHKGFLRPLKAAQIRLVFDASAGHYTAAYRTLHVALFGLTLWMFVRALRVKTTADMAAGLFALTVMLGLHTFSNLLREAYPINHFLEILLFTLIALNVAQSAPRLRNDVLGGVLFALGSLVVESGLLIWVVIVATRLSGFKGFSWRGVGIVTGLFLGYVALRVFVFANGIPVVNERTTGYFFKILEEDELIARFGANPWPLYAYNVVASVLTVLFAEPRAGQLVTTAQWLDGSLMPWAVVATVSSVVTTLVIGVGAVSWWRNRGTTSDPDRFFLVCGMVLIANAVLSFAYTKSDIVSVAGAFYALAAYAAVRRLASSTSSGMLARSLVTVLVVVAATGWALRDYGLHYSLRYHAFKVRNDWVNDLPEKWMATPDVRVVTERLRRDALEQRVLAPRFYPRWEEQWFEE